MNLKEQVKEYWNNEVCETKWAKSEKYSKGYFEELENYRYNVTPNIFSFAQFTRWYGKKVLEIGIGAGTDFIQFARAGADIYGIDLTEESIEHVKKRLELYCLKGDIRVADAEHLPFDDNTFDLAYSFGVLHHTPDTVKAIREAIRVTKKGGRIKLMLYHRHSVMALWIYLRTTLIQMKIKSLTWCIAHGIESIGTKAYTFGEIKKIMNSFPVEIIELNAQVNKYDYAFRYPKIFQYISGALINLFGHSKSGFFMTIELKKI